MVSCPTHGKLHVLSPPVLIIYGIPCWWAVRLHRYVSSSSLWKACCRYPLKFAPEERFFSPVRCWSIERGVPLCAKPYKLSTLNYTAYLIFQWRRFGAAGKILLCTEGRLSPSGAQRSFWFSSNAINCFWGLITLWVMSSIGPLEIGPCTQKYWMSMCQRVYCRKQTRYMSVCKCKYADAWCLKI